MPVVQLNDIVLHHLSIDQPRPIGARREDVVMVHGLGANVGFWYLRIAPMLSAYSRVTLFDLRGHGLSGMPPSGYSMDILAADMRALLDHLEIESAHVVAHSFGGSVAARFACEHGERVKSLTLVDTRLRSLQPQLRLRDWAYWPRYRQQIGEVGIELDEEGGEFGMQLFNLMARLRLHDPDKADQLATKLPSPFSGKSGKRSAMRWLQLLETTTAWDEFTRSDDVTVDGLRSLRMPVVGIYGEYSQALSTAHALTRLCQQIEIEIIPKVGHFFPLSMPEKVVAPVVSLLGHRLPEVADADIPPWTRGTGTQPSARGLFKKN